MEPKFKKGDRVVCVPPATDNWIGCFGTVVEYQSSGSYYEVNMDGDHPGYPSPSTWDERYLDFALDGLDRILEKL